MSGDDKPRTIKLFCPSVSKLVRFVAWDGQKLDLGSIARAFGLDPSTVKLNGHFISRGLDLVSSSVTWRSLLSFFSSKGLSTGTDEKGALIVDGKLCKVGTKRAHEPQDVVNGNQHGAGKSGIKDVGITAKPQLEEIYSLKNKKIKDSSSDFPGRGNCHSSTASSTPWKCSYLSGGLKRVREDEVIAAASCKRISSGCHSR